MRNAKFIGIILIVTAFLYLFSLGGMALTDPDESFYAETSREMLVANEWVTPHIFGEPQFEKPALYYWLVMLSYIVFGVTEFAARFPSAIFGILGAIGVYFLAKRLYSSLCGIFSALILATCALYLLISRACVTDMALTVFILYCLLFFVNGWTTGKKIHYFASAVMAALAVLTKGPIGLFIPGMTMLLYIAFTKQWKELRKVPIFWSIVVFVIVSFPWYFAISQAHGVEFWGEFIGFRNLTRFLEPEHRIGDSPFFYFPVAFGGFFPWCAFLLFAVWYMIKDKIKSLSFKGDRLFLLVWFLTVFVFFSVSRTKLVTYILPLFPVMAIVTGRFWEGCCISGEIAPNVRKYFKFSYILLMIAALGGAIALPILLGHEYPGTMALKGGIIAGAGFLLFCVLSAVLFFRGKQRIAFASIVVAVLVMLVPVASYILPVVEQYESSKAVSIKVQELASPGDLIGGECDHRRGIAFYTRSVDIVDIHPYNEMMLFFESDKKVWGISQYKHYRQLKGHKGELIEDPVFRSGDYVILTNKVEN